MKKLPILLSLSLVLLSSVFSLKAAQETTEIDINVNFPEFLNFTGSAAGASKYYTVEEIEPVSGSAPIVTLGDLGLESNISGDCDIEFSAKNNFRLRHTVSDERLTHYRLRWKGEVMSGNSARTNKFTMACNSEATAISFQSVAYFNPNPQAGLYQDIVTVTVTTQ